MMQFQADILEIRVVRPKVTETTAGAAMLAGLAVNYWNTLDELKKKWMADREFTPVIDERERGGVIWHGRRQLKGSLACKGYWEAILPEGYGIHRLGQVI